LGADTFVFVNYYIIIKSNYGYSVGICKSIVIFWVLKKRKEEGSKGKTIKDIYIKETASEAPRSVVCLYRDWICIKSIICVLK
jgi:hypothetical protein